MRQLTSTQNCAFLFGALMMVIGAGLHMLSTTPLLPFLDALTDHRIAACLFLLGAVCFTSMQFLQKYDGDDFNIRRLRRMQLIGDALLVLAALLMAEDAFRFLYHTFAQDNPGFYTFYTQYLAHNNWVVFLLVACFLQVYTTHRIANILRDK